MIRCRKCGKPVGAGQAVGGDVVVCAVCLVATESDGDGTLEQWRRVVASQLAESRQEKASGAWRRRPDKKRKA